MTHYNVFHYIRLGLSLKRGVPVQHVLKTELVSGRLAGLPMDSRSTTIESVVVITFTTILYVLYFQKRKKLYVLDKLQIISIKKIST